MPTIDELAPATAAADSDTLAISQNGITRKITRTQVLAGVQTQLAIPGATLMGRTTAGVGSPETIAIGSFLTLASGTLSALAAPYSIALTPRGLVPLPNDYVAVGQNGTNVSVPYSVFLQGLTAVANLNGSQLQVIPTGTTTSMRLADLATSLVSKSGGSLTGSLVLASDPTAPLQAATKQYADLKISRTGDALAGPLFLAGDPLVPTQAATKHYVDVNMGAVLPLTGGTLSGPLTLNAAPAAASQAANKQYVDAALTDYLPLSGGSVSGMLALAGAPTAAFHAATKQYVDANPGPTGVINVRLPPCNAKLDGVSDDTAAFIAAYQLAPAGGTIYVPNGVTVIQPAANWSVPLTKRVRWIVDGTALANGTPLADAIPTGTYSGTSLLPATTTGLGASGLTVSQSASQATDFAVLHTSYVITHTGGAAQSIISNARTDTTINQGPLSNVWAGMDRLVWNGAQTPASGAPSKHAARFTQAVRQIVGTDTSGNPLPQPLMLSSYVQYVDATGRPSSWTNASAALQTDWIGNGADDAGQRQIQSLVLGQYNTAGAAVEVGSGIAVALAAGSTGKLYKVFDVRLPYSVSVLDTTNATQLSGAAAIRMAAGQAIAFEATNSVNLSYTSSTGAIVAKYGAITCAVGRGLSAAFGPVFSANATLSATSAGCVIFLLGSGNYTIALPPAANLTTGTGFTFSALGAGTVTIAAASGDSIDLAPITLRQYDRYHIVSDGSSVWREMFRTNAVSPRFQGVPVLPSYLVSTLPTTASAGGKAFASNGRKPSETAGAGTGVEVFFDGAHWISVCGGQTVTA